MTPRRAARGLQPHGHPYQAWRRACRQPASTDLRVTGLVIFLKKKKKKKCNFFEKKNKNNKLNLKKKTYGYPQGPRPARRPPRGAPVPGAPPPRCRVTRGNIGANFLTSRAWLQPPARGDPSLLGLSRAVLAGWLPARPTPSLVWMATGLQSAGPGASACCRPARRARAAGI